MKFDLCISVRDRSQESKVDVEAYFDTGLMTSELFAFWHSVPNRWAVMGNIVPNALSEQVLGKQHGAHLGPTGPRWAPCWPHGLCYRGLYQSLSGNTLSKLNTIVYVLIDVLVA